MGRLKNYLIAAELDEIEALDRRIMKEEMNRDSIREGIFNGDVGLSGINSPPSGCE